MTNTQLGFLIIYSSLLYGIGIWRGMALERERKRNASKPDVE